MKSIFVGLAAAIFAAAPATAQNPPPPSPPRIITSGTGEVRVTPDQAAVALGVRTRAMSASAAGAENARVQRAILDTLRALGIPAGQIATVGYNVSPEMEYPPNGGTPKVTGYTVSNTVRVELLKIDQVGKVIDASLKKGANEISSLQFSASNADEVRRTALADAVSKARAEAEALAKAAGGTLGGLIELSSSGPVYRPMAADVGFAMAKATPTPIEPGEQTISATVSAIWRFVPGSGG